MDRYKVISTTLLQKHITSWLEDMLDAFSNFDVVSYTETPLEATNVRVTLIFDDPIARTEIMERELMKSL